jgi:hypothetical protein
VCIDWPVTVICTRYPARAKPSTILQVTEYGSLWQR